MPNKPASKQDVPERLHEPRTEDQEAEYFLTEFSKGECLGRIRGCLTQSQVRSFVGVANELGVEDTDIFEACRGRIQELEQFKP